MAIRKTIDEQVLTFTDTESGESMRFGAHELDGDMYARLAMHGLSQKLGDSYSGKSGWHECMAAAAEVWTSLKEGNWTTGGGGGQLATALAAVTGKPLEECIAKIKGMHQEARKELRKPPQIAAWIAAENAKKKAAKAQGANVTDLEDLF